MSAPLVRVGELAEQIRGVTYAKQDASSTTKPGYLPVLRAGNITDDGLDFDDLVFVPADRISTKQRIRKFDVVIAASSGSLAVVGKAAPAPDDYEGGFGAFCKVLRPGPKVDPRYFAHFFKTGDYRRRISALAAGIGINNLRGEHLDGMTIPLPALPEQRRIAEVLDRAEALRAKRRAALAQLDTLTQSIFLDMFGDPLANPKGFPMRTLAEFYLNPEEGTRCGPFGSALKKSELASEGIAVWNMDNIDSGGRMVLPFRMWIPETKYRELEAYAVAEGDVIISRAGTVGRMCVATTSGARSIISTNLIRLRFGPGLLPLYFVSLMTHCRGRVGRLRAGADGAFTHMSTGILDTLKFPYPPLELQTRFAEVVASVERRKAEHHRSLAHFDALFASLQHRAFRGEL